MDKTELRQISLCHACGMVKVNEEGLIIGFSPEEVLDIAEKYFQFLIKDSYDNKPDLKIVKEN